MSPIAEFLILQAVAHSMKEADDAEKVNAETAENAGVITTVVRTYDDVGLHGGKDVCQWCKSREGTWDYQDAVRNGVFERHPGCECQIEVIYSKGARRVQTSGRNNAWKEMPEGRRERLQSEAEELRQQPRKIPEALKRYLLQQATGRRQQRG